MKVMAKQRETPGRSVIGLALVTTWISTGGNFIAFKGALEGLAPTWLMSFRLLIAAAVLVPLALLRHAPWPPIAQIRNGLIAGCLLLVLGQGAIIWGVQYLPAGRTAVFVSSAPLFLAVYSALFGKPLDRRTLIGIGLGTVGLATMAVFGRTEGEWRLGAVVIVLAGSAAWALGSLFAHRADMPSDPTVSGAIQTLAAGLVVLPAALFIDGAWLDRAEGLSTVVLVSLGYLGIVGLALGYTAFAWLDKVVRPAVANSFQYAAPVIALAAGALILGEEPTAIDLAASAISLAGVAVMVSAKQDERKR
jgi:drug/metabolite transporter (DMT)-like permease